MKDLLLRLSTSIRNAVQPWVLPAEGGEVVGRAHSGDATFKIDEVAEEHLAAFLKEAGSPVDLVFLDSQHRVVTIHENIKPISFDPATWRIYRPGKPARYALAVRWQARPEPSRRGRKPLPKR